MMSLSALKRVKAHVRHRREGDVEQEGRVHASLAETLLHGEPLRALTYVEPHTCPHAISHIGRMMQKFEPRNDNKLMLK